MFCTYTAIWLELFCWRLWTSFKFCWILPNCYLKRLLYQLTPTNWGNSLPYTTFPSPTSSVISLCFYHSSGHKISCLKLAFLHSEVEHFSRVYRLFLYLTWIAHSYPCSLFTAFLTDLEDLFKCMDLFFVIYVEGIFFQTVSSRTSLKFWCG